MVFNEGSLRPVGIIGAASAHYGEFLMSARFDPPDSFWAEPAKQMRPHEKEKAETAMLSAAAAAAAAYDSGSAAATHGSGSGSYRQDS